MEKWGDKYCAFTSKIHTMTEPDLLLKLNIPGLSVRKCMKLLIMILHGLVEGLYKSHSMIMCSWNWTLALLHEQLVGRWCKGMSRVVLSEFWGSVLLMAQWQIMYRTPIIPDSSCLCHVVRCLLLVVLGHSVIIGQLPWCCVPDYLV